MANILRLVNIGLITLLAIIFLLWIFSSSTTGYFSYLTNSEEPKCKFISSDLTSHDIKNIDLCCFEIQKMIHCDRIHSDYDYVCYNSEEGNKYYLNSKTYSYCLKEGYDI